MDTSPQVAVFVETSLIYGRRILTGIVRYMRSHRQWSLFVEPNQAWTHVSAALTSKRWDGVLTRFTNPASSQLFQQMKVPLVDLNDCYQDSQVPWVGSDHQAIGRLGALHLLERGFRHFAFCGALGERWSEQRRDGFCAVLEKEGFSVSVFEAPFDEPASASWDETMDCIADWIKKLPKPVAIMAANDFRGLHVVNACRRLKLNIPEEAAVIGVDNEELLCEICTPHLSSIVPDPERIGFEAAKLLDSLMTGESPVKKRIIISPLRVAARGSTDVVAATDWVVAGAMKYIREQSLRGCKVIDVQRYLGVSESTLKRHFQGILHSSPKDEIHRIQLERIKQLLAETDFTLEHIAELSGFEHPEYMSVLFKREIGQTPGEYRKQFENARGLM